jgi:hypothetical protein
MIHPRPTTLALSSQGRKAYSMLAYPREYLLT